MTISELTDEQLSRWIAKKLEPCPAKDAIPAGSTYNVSKPSRWLLVGVSSTGAWWCHFDIDFGYSIGDWQPRDIVNDPAMTVMLLEKLSRYYVELSGRFINGTMHYICNKHLNPTLVLGRAVAEAFTLCQGFKGEITWPEEPDDELEQ